MQHLKTGYTDVLNMPTGERRYYLGLLVKSKNEEQARHEAMSRSSGKKRRVSGEALKNQITSGKLPLN